MIRSVVWVVVAVVAAPGVAGADGPCDAEAAAVRRPLQNVVELLACARRASLFLGDGNRGAAQVFDPGHHAATDLGLGIAFLQTLEHDCGNVFAAAPDGATATGDQHFPFGAFGNQGFNPVGLACRPGNKGLKFTGFNPEIAYQINVWPTFVDLLVA